MQQPDLTIWKALMAAIESDDAAAIETLAGSVGESFAGALRGHHPLDELRRTPLMLAYWWGKPLASTALVNAGSDYQQQDANGHGCAWYARRFGDGAAQGAMGALIRASERRISMEKVIAEGASPVRAPAKRRRPDV